MTPVVLIIAYDSYKQTYLCTGQSRTTYLVQPLRLCQHAYSQRVAWPHALPGGSARQASTRARRDAIYEYTTPSKMKKMLYFVETKHEVAETIILRQHVAVALLLLWILIVLGALYC